MNSPEIKCDGTYIYRDSNGSAILALKDFSVYDRDTQEIIGYETVGTNYNTKEQI